MAGWGGTVPTQNGGGKPTIEKRVTAILRIILKGEPETIAEFIG